LRSRTEPVRSRFADAAVIVIGPNDMLIHAEDASGAAVDLDRRHDFVEKVRELPVNPPDSVAGFTVIGGVLHVAATSIIAPVTARKEAATPQGVVMVLVPLGDTFLARLSRDFLIDDLRVEMPPDVKATIGMRIEKPEGGTMALVTWKPAAPGRELFD